MPTASDKAKARALLTSYTNVMEVESDRGCLLVGLSQIADELGVALKATLFSKGFKSDAEWLLDTKPGSRPLANLAVRTRMAVCLGLISNQERKIIDALRKLRNEHAHGTVPFVLTSENLKPILNAFPAKITEVFPFFSNDEIEWDLEVPKKAFVFIVSAVATNIQYASFKRQLESIQAVLANFKKATMKSADNAQSPEVTRLFDELGQLVAARLAEIQSIGSTKKATQQSSS